MAEAWHYCLRLGCGGGCLHVWLQLHLGAFCGGMASPTSDVLSCASSTPRASGHSSPALLEDVESVGTAENAERESETDLLSDKSPAAVHSEKWVPGANVEPWIGRGAPAGMQAQVLITNALMSLKGLPAKVLRSWRESFALEAGCRSSSATQIGARLLGMNVGSVESVFNRIRGNSWTPTSRAEEPEDVGGGLSPQAAQSHEFLCNVVRVSLANSIEGNSHTSYIKEMQRMTVARRLLPNVRGLFRIVMLCRKLGRARGGTFWPQRMGGADEVACAPSSSSGLQRVATAQAEAACAPSSPSGLKRTTVPEAEVAAKQRARKCQRRSAMAEAEAACAPSSSSGLKRTTVPEAEVAPKQRARKRQRTSD